MWDFDDRFDDEHEVEEVEPCEDDEHEHDAANYDIEFDGNLELGTCKHCGRTFVVHENEEESE